MKYVTTPLSDRPLKQYEDGEPCSHPGCRNHWSHPCEGCGRYGARGEATETPVIDHHDTTRGNQ